MQYCTVGTYIRHTEDIGPATTVPRGATCWLMASYDTCYYMLFHYIIYIYAIVLSYRIILLLLLLYLYIYKQLHGNDDMNLCKSYFIYDIVTHINSSILNHFLI